MQACRHAGILASSLPLSLSTLSLGRRRKGGIEGDGRERDGRRLTSDSADSGGLLSPLPPF